MKNAETSNGHAASSLSSLCEELFMVSCNVELREFSSVDQKYRSSSTSEFSFGEVHYTVGARVKRPKTARRQDGLTLSLNVPLSMVLRVIYKRAVQLITTILVCFHNGGSNNGNLQKIIQPIDFAINTLSNLWIRRCLKPLLSF